LKYALLLVILIGVSGCNSNEGCLEILEPTNLLEEPYAIGYPSTNPIPNRVLKIMDKETVVITDKSYEKDFLCTRCVRLAVRLDM
jgi:hypothetical protein